MRFSKGLWQMLEASEPDVPALVHEAKRTSDALVVRAPNRPRGGGVGSYSEQARSTIRN